MSKQSEAVLARRAKNHEQYNAYMRQWRARNKEKVSENNRRYRANNGEKLRAYFRRINKTKVRRQARCDWLLQHPDVKKAHDHKRLAAKRGNGGSFTAKEWADLKKYHSYRCLACGKKKQLTADHVLPISLGGSSNISNIQPLCQGCNSRKHNKHIDYR